MICGAGGPIGGGDGVAFTRHTDGYPLDTGHRATALDLAGGEI